MKTLTLSIYFLRHLGVAALLMLCGCSHTEYEIELTPKGDQIDRKLVLWKAGGKIEEPSANEMARITPLYADTFQPDHEKKLGFVGTFQERPGSNESQTRPKCG